MDDSMSIYSTGLSPEERSAGGAMKLKPLAVTVNTACALTGLGPTKIWSLIKEDRLEAVRVDRRTLIKFSSLERLLDSQHAPRRRGRPRKRVISASTAAEVAS
jgi:excisionase family DNA binding protein